jgi:hypothetical protein
MSPLPNHSATNANFKKLKSKLQSKYITNKVKIQESIF